MTKSELGIKIREARKIKGYTQEQLAERANISTVYLGEIERGLKMPGTDIFSYLVAALDISADYILRDKLPSGKEYVYDELTKKLEKLNPKQRKTISDIIDAYLQNI